MDAYGNFIKYCIHATVASAFVVGYSFPALANYDDGARYAFIGSKADSAIFVIDMQKRTNVHTVHLSTVPDTVAASDALKALIVGHAPEKMLTLVDLSADSPLQLDYPLTLRPDNVLVSPIGETVAILDQGKQQLQVHALRRKQVLLTVDNVVTETALTFNPDGSTVYWVDQSGGTLHSIDLWSDRKELRLSAEDGALSAMTRSIDGTLGFIADRQNSLVYVVDLRNFRLLRTSRAGDAPGRPWGTADGQYMLVPNGDGSVTAISTLTSESIYTVDAVADPISINAGWIDTTAAIVGRDGKIVFINIADGKMLDDADLKSTTREGIVTSDSKTLAVPAPDNGTLVFFDMQKRQQLSVIDELPIDIGPASIALSNNLCH